MVLQLAPMATFFFSRKHRKARSERSSAPAVEPVRIHSPWEAVTKTLSDPYYDRREAFFRGFLSSFTPESHLPVRLLSEAEGLWADWAALGADYWSAADSVGTGRLARLNPRDHV